MCRQELAVSWVGAAWILCNKRRLHEKELQKELQPVWRWRRRWKADLQRSQRALLGKRAVLQRTMSPEHLSLSASWEMRKTCDRRISHA
mmetsp:Transcript_46572/g.74094  ORF Transcript_46572/g.74094 Transcript_46572/m.74094 type:complete len:89 (-) Transcript_46572:130-396(-)